MSIAELFKKQIAQQPSKSSTPAASNTKPAAPANNGGSSSTPAVNTNSAQNTPTQQTASLFDSQSRTGEQSDFGFGNINSMSDSEIDSAYAEFIKQKNEAGFKTTHMRNDDEVNFAEYAAALSAELQDELASYFADGALNQEEAIEAQQKIAGIYKDLGKSNLHVDEFARAVRSLGYDIEWGTVRTSYIIDDKKSHDKGGGTATEGNITIFTIKNKEGEVLFKVADTNGNAAIEIEEVFANELITGIANQIDQANLLASAGKFKGGSGGGGSYDVTIAGLTGTSVDSEGNIVDGTTDTTKEEAQKEGNKYVINQAQYNKLLNEKAKIFKEMGLEQQDAMANAKTYMSANYIVDSSAAGNAVKAADFSSASNGYTIVTIDKSDSSIETEESYTEIVIEEPEQKLEEELELEVA